jgi:uncharacterized protein (TIGR02453 family)
MNGHFTPGFFTFFADLAAHNDRAWFADNKARYVADVERPMLAFIGEVGARLADVSPSFVANRRRIGGSMVPIQRNMRFAGDAAPFRTSVAARFQHRGPYDGSRPAFYIHLAPGHCFGGGGIYHADPATITRLRQGIVSSPEDWRRVRDLAEDDRDRLQRVPAGFDRAHEFAEDLTRKNYFALASFAEDEVTAPDFIDRYLASCHRAAPLVAFITGALGLPQ